MSTQQYATSNDKMETPASKFISVYAECRAMGGEYADSDRAAMRALALCLNFAIERKFAESAGSKTSDPSDLTRTSQGNSGVTPTTKTASIKADKEKSTSTEPFFPLAPYQDSDDLIALEPEDLIVLSPSDPTLIDSDIPPYLNLQYPLIPMTQKEVKQYNLYVYLSLLMTAPEM